MRISTARLAARSISGYLRYIPQLMRRSAEPKRIVKFCIVGGSGLGVYEGTLFLLTDKLGLLYIISAIFSWVITILFMFTLHESWTFRDLRKPGASNILKRVSSFSAVRLTGFAIHITILSCLTEFLGVYYLLSALIAIAIVMTWNYTASLNLVWRR